MGLICGASGTERKWLWGPGNGLGRSVGGSRKCASKGGGVLYKTVPNAKAKRQLGGGREGKREREREREMERERERGGGGGGGGRTPPPVFFVCFITWLSRAPKVPAALEFLVAQRQAMGLDLQKAGIRAAHLPSPVSGEAQLRSVITPVFCLARPGEFQFVDCVRVRPGGGSPGNHRPGWLIGSPGNRVLALTTGRISDQGIV
jgi:hypothetical protein